MLLFELFVKTALKYFWQALNSVSNRDSVFLNRFSLNYGVGFYHILSYGGKFVQNIA
jgi:hypothetical protein